MKPLTTKELGLMFPVRQNNVPLNVEGGYTRIPHWFNELPLDADQRAFMLLLATKTWGDHDKAYCFLSTEEIRAYMKRSADYVQKIRKQLITSGYIAYTAGNGGRNAKGTYSILINGKPINSPQHVEFNSDADTNNPTQHVEFNANNSTYGVGFNGINSPQHVDAINKDKKDIKKDKSASNESRVSPKKVLPSPPAEINETAWAEFVEHRKEIKAPLTALACTKLFGQLQSVSKDMQQAMIDASISNGWKGLFPIKDLSAKGAVGSPAASRNYDPLGVDDTSWIEGCDLSRYGVEE